METSLVCSIVSRAGGCLSDSRDHPGPPASASSSSLSSATTPRLGSERHRKDTAAYKKGSGGLPVVSSKGDRGGTVARIDDEVFNLWDDGETKIATLELLMIFHGLLCFPALFLQTSGVWYVDNVVALMALVKGRSESQELDVIAQSMHQLLFHLRCNLWFEWVQSHSNWADAISQAWHQQFEAGTVTTSLRATLWGVLLLEWMKPLKPDLQAEVIVMLLTLTIHQHAVEIYRDLDVLANNSVGKLIGLRLRRERVSKTDLAKELEKLQL